MNETDNQLNITCEESYQDDDKYGVSRPDYNEEKTYGGWEGHWPGDGSGLSDFDDYNQNEGMDY